MRALQKEKTALSRWGMADRLGHQVGLGPQDGVWGSRKLSMDWGETMAARF
ncbi:hypothetical protein RSK20926_02509 [Roseobacter sp. SK209-2-6]|nr:hypothetical protein RSK20926_02509 [Roseobacter sp. SK209-2-6]